MSEDSALAADVADAAGGRPSAGQALAQTLDEAAGRRAKSRNVGALRRLSPFVAAHWGDATLSALFLLVSTSATLGLSGAVRVLIDRTHVKAAGLNSAFLLLGAVALALALATAGRYFFITKLGERVVADLRKVVYGRILTLDPAFFLHTRTGEVLSRLTTDI
ncbi:MAG TPA: ABC transporter transmembrane domain-containing protein, partial [Phenylobacterium sp.]|uniref:ABC transporter transmembrane domain-containing protein n=1 Tax=Phenylobacterium sp. TaxID=1871053 RepID=UPI002B4A38A5